MTSKLKAVLNIPGYLQSLFSSNEDPIDASKKLVNSIQRFVGIDDVFGDYGQSGSIFLLGIPLFFGSFFYVGTFSQLVYLIQVFPDKLETFKALNCISATCVPLSKYIFMWLSRSRLRNVFNMCRQGLTSLPEGSISLSTFLHTLRRAQYMAWLVLSNQLFTHVLYLLIPFVMTLIDGSERYLPTTPGDSYGLSPKYETPYYEATFVVTTLATCFSAINQTGYIILFVFILAHELGHYYAISETLRQLREKLSAAERDNTIGTEERDKFVKETLTFCIRHHQFIMQFHAKIRDLYKAIFGAHFFMMTMVLVTTLQTLGFWDIRNTILTGATGILPLFIYCFGGELLISARTELASALHDCGWEMMAAKQARSVLLMLNISQRPLNLTATGIFVMNRETFGDVAQVVYKVYTVFN